MLIGDKKFMLQAKDNNNHIHKLIDKENILYLFQP